MPPFPLPLDLPLTPSGRIDYDRWGEDDPVLRQVKLALIDNVREYGGSDEAFEWMPIDVLNVVFALAAWWVHENESPRGGAAKEMNIEAVASCVRAGYGVRGFELAVGEPLLPFGRHLDDDEPAG